MKNLSMENLSFMQLVKTYEVMKKYDEEERRMRNDPSVSIGALHALDRNTLIQLKFIFGLTYLNRLPKEVQIEKIKKMCEIFHEES